MQIGILEAGRPPAELVEQYGSYADMIRLFLNREKADWSFVSYPVIDGLFPNGPTVCDAWVISSSHHGVYENLPWMRRLKLFLQQAVSLSVPVVGICFGHQILAEAMGGVVQKSEKGWGLGMQEYTLQACRDFTDGLPRNIRLHAIHQDQVVSCPPGATVVASSAFCPYAILAYGNTAVGIQAHPEFSRDFERNLLVLRRGKSLPEDLVQTALNSLDPRWPGTDSSAVARWVANFIGAAQDRNAP